MVKNKILLKLLYINILTDQQKNEDYTEKGWPNFPMTKYGFDLIDVMKNDLR